MNTVTTNQDPNGTHESDTQTACQTINAGGLRTLDPVEGKTTPPKPGVHFGMTSKEYHDTDALNHSTLNGFHESAAKGVHEMKDDTTTESMAFGTAFHTRLLEPDNFKDEYVILDANDGPINPTTNKLFGPTSQKYQNWEFDFIANLDEGQKVLRIDDAERIEAMIEAVKSNPSAAGFATTAYPKREMSLFWDEVFTVGGEDISVRCKARVDLYIDKLGHPINMPAMLDLKTTTSAYYDNFQRSVKTYGYHRQMAWYLRGLHMLGMMPDIHDRAAMILAVESQAPYQTAIYYIDHESIRQGMHEHKEHALAYIRWRLTGEAPGLPHKPRPITLPPWERISSQEIITTSITGERL